METIAPSALFPIGITAVFIAWIIQLFLSLPDGPFATWVEHRAERQEMDDLLKTVFGDKRLRALRRQNRTSKYREWIKKRDPINAIASAGLIIGLAIVLLVTTITKASPGKLVEDFYANWSTELIFFAFTIFVINRLTQQKINQEEKQRIIRQMSSPSKDFALEAIRIVRDREWLTDGSLKEADLSSADWSNADLSLANLEQVILLGANLQGANFAEANLQKADLGATDFRNANLASADLRGVNLYDGDLRNAKLYRTQLQGAKLFNTDLRGADLTCAQLLDADLRRASLEDTILKAVKYNDDTKWPEGFKPSQHGAEKGKWQWFDGFDKDLWIPDPE